MNSKKHLRVYFLLSLIGIGAGFIIHNHPPILQKSITIENFGDVTFAEPMWNANTKNVVLVFMDTTKFSASRLGEQIATTGVTTAIIDTTQFFKAFNSQSEQCLNSAHVTAFIKTLTKKIPKSIEKHLIIAGIAEGALIPFINAQSVTDATNLSIGFSVDLPHELVLCSSLVSQYQNQKLRLVASDPLEGDWRSVWTDQPAAKTGVFIRTLGNIDTRIADYDTTLDTLLIEELNVSLGRVHQILPPMPVVEVPATRPSDNLTLFYSGDGGWRDLDRTVANEMAALNYPVAGVDVLRYFWKAKTPEQTAADLASTMAYYRKKWGIKTFVLAGYSFGADILPAVYNQLSTDDKDSVALLVLLGLAKSADFEIHVSGWLEKSAGERFIAPELSQIPKDKILCIYGKEEKAETACITLENSAAKVLELSGGHHFDQDYPKLTREILDIYQQHGIN